MYEKHVIIRCSCGALIAQCRCPSPNKPVEVRERACPKCQMGAPAAEPRAPLPVTWARLAEIAEQSIYHISIAPGVTQTIGFNWHRFIELIKTEAQK